MKKSRIVRRLAVVACLSCPPLAAADARAPLAAAETGSVVRAVVRARLSARIAELELSEPQKSALRDTLAQHRPGLARDLRAVHESLQRLRRTIRAPGFDEQAVRAAHRELAAVTEDLAVHRAALVDALRAPLTPEQNLAVAEMIERVNGLVDSGIEGLAQAVETAD